MKRILSTLWGAILISGLSAWGQVPELKSIPFSDIQGVSVGNAQDEAAGTGVTVFRLTKPSLAAVEVFGGGPASRETEVIAVERNHPINALVFSGGSAFGLAASNGVARCLEKHGVGYETGSALVPLVCQSCIYDLGYRSATIRPDEKMGYAACEASFSGNTPRSGSVGAGTGATVGKAAGMEKSQKAGIGYAALQMGSLQIGVAVVLNSYGDIYYQGKKIAGMQSAEADSYTTLLQTAEENLFVSTPSGTTNTTLVAVFTNGDFSPAQLKHLAQMASAGLARSINPAFTTADGDTVYALSVGKDTDKVTAQLDAVGALTATLVEEAIADAVRSAGIQ
ncbi:MAG: P1 family peptidase [Bacteroidales bacterium]|jgi:L-aminopeptidase/D-esterase-like protein|nr:P1 family peptidase [Bacteroidales bacterium]